MISQLSPEWFAQRVGHVTASRMNDVMAKGKVTPRGVETESLTRKKYLMQIVTERLTGKAEDSHTNSYMEWGKEQEPFARMAYEAHAGVLVDESPFCLHPTIKWLGASPDGFIYDGSIEIKCPTTQVHLGYRLDNRVPTKYMNQIQCQMWCAGRIWADFISFDPRLPERLQLFVFRTQRNEEIIKDMEKEVIKFLAEVDETILKLEEV